MKKEDLKTLLLACVTDCEWHGLELGDDTLQREMIRCRSVSLIGMSFCG